MKKRINTGFIIVAFISIFATMFLLTWAYFGRFETQMQENLRGYARIVQSCGDVHEMDTLTELKDDGIRITLIEADGTVRYDNYVDVREMENHASRPEVVGAMAEGEGADVRESKSLAQSTYYYAVLLPDGSVLRVAQVADNMFSFFLSGLSGVVIVVCIVLIVSLSLAHLLTIALVDPVEKLAHHLEDETSTACYEELEPFLETIRKQHRDLKHSAKLREEFTANVTHELKTPLTSISGYAELIETGMASGEDVTRFAGGIRKNAKRLLRLIDDTIRLAELDVTEGALEMERINLYAMAGDLVETLEESAKQHGVTISLEGDDCFAIGNRMMIEEVIFNLCDNAIRYNKEGGSVKVSAIETDKGCVLKVSDTGIGIKAEHQERIFERFYRVDKSRSKKTGGTGLGLAIVKHIVARHGAELTIDSEWGKGTVMEILFLNKE